MPQTPVLDRIAGPADLRALSDMQLAQLANEVRADVIDSVSRTGGHLGSSLGVVELTVAIHAVFDTPRDKLIWDVGHQCYAHKVLTGRRHQMKTLRQKDGLSGFTKRAESPFDPFGAAHSSTSISAALGFAVGRDMGMATGDAIAVIGDGAMTAGMAYEAMNNAGAEGRRLFVILNDNDMSIAPPVGAMARYLTRLQTTPPGAALRDLAAGFEALLPGGLREHAQRTRQLVTGMPGSGTLFEELGFTYIGPINGHSMPDLLATLRAARTLTSGPVLIHAITQKGKGYAPAEAAKDKYHGVSKFDISSGQQAKASSNAPSYTSVFGRALTDEAGRDPTIVAVTAAMPNGTGVDIMQRRFPGRVFDVGIAEQHAVTFAAGMAASGLKPFCAIYSTFLQRGYDQIVHDVALQGLPVRFAIDRAGLVGADGATHAGSFDIGYLSSLPGMVVMAAADEAELMHMVATAVAHNSGPIAFRFPRGDGVGVDLPERGQVLRIGKGRVVRDGGRVALLSFGTRISEVLKACDALADRGLFPTVADARFAKPLDRELILRLASTHEALITIEEGAIGGFGSHVAQLLAEEGVFDCGLKYRSMVLPDVFIDQASPGEMFDRAGLNACHIETKVLDVLGIARIDRLRA